MSATTRYLIPATILVVGAGLSFIWCKTSQGDDPGRRDQRPGSTTELASQGTDPSRPARTKSKARIPTVEQTEELLRSTIIPLAELPEQSLSETIAAINRLIEDAGVEPNTLRLACDPSNPIANMKMGRIRMRNVPVAAILQIVMGNRAVRYRVREGMVEFIPPYMGDVDE